MRSRSQQLCHILALVSVLQHEDRGTDRGAAIF
jgi:hypothetical protein